jgi:hypothetical protein
MLTLKYAVLLNKIFLNLNLNLNLIFLKQQLQNKIKKTGLPTDKFWSQAMQHSTGSNVTVEYETEFENILGC